MSPKTSFRFWKICSSRQFGGKAALIPGGKLPKVWVLWEQEKEKAAFLTTGRSRGYLGDISVRSTCTQLLLGLFPQ